MGELPMVGFRPLTDLLLLLNPNDWLFCRPGSSQAAAINPNYDATRCGGRNLLIPLLIVKRQTG